MVTEKKPEKEKRREENLASRPGITRYSNYPTKTKIPAESDKFYKILTSSPKSIPLMLEAEK